MEGLRLNTVRTPQSLVHRHLPAVDTESIRRAAVTTRAFEATVKRPVAGAAADRLQRARRHPPHPPLLPELRGRRRRLSRRLRRPLPPVAGGRGAHRRRPLLRRRRPRAGRGRRAAGVADDDRRGAELPPLHASGRRTRTSSSRTSAVRRSRRFLIEPFTFPRVGDSVVADLVAEAQRRAVDAVAALLPGRERPHRRRLRADRGRLPVRDARHVPPLPAR